MLNHAKGWSRRSTTGFFWAAAAMVAAAVFLRCYRLESVPGLNPDEVETTLQWFGQHPTYWYLSPSGRPLLNPLAPVLLFPFALLARPAAWVVRMPALIVGLAVLPSTFLVIRKAFDRLTAQGTVLLVATAPALIAYSRLGWDAAYVPLWSALAVGLAFQRRWLLAALSTVLLGLAHPVSVFILPLLAAPAVQQLWSRRADSPRRAANRFAILIACASGYGVFLMLLVAQFEHIPLAAGSLHLLVGVTVDRLTSVGPLGQFASGYWHLFDGSLIYAGFVGLPSASPAIWAAPVIALTCTAGAWLNWRKGRRAETALLISVPLALLAQAVAQGPTAVDVLNERYAIWAIVPSCLALAVLIGTVCDLLRAARWAPAMAAAISVFWLASFYVSYTRPFDVHGGSSPVLDYRSATPEAKEQVIELVRRNRQHAGTPALLFVGETRLDLGLTYLASGGRDIEVKNLGRVAYDHFQRDDHQDLRTAFEEYQRAARDVFFVDWAWDEGLTGSELFIRPPVGTSLEKISAPWTAAKLQIVRAPDQRPLMTIWRLSVSPGA